MAGKWVRMAVAMAMALTGVASQVSAQDRVTLGWGRAFTNDGLGDFKDRWRTGSYTVSRVRGPTWSGELPTAFGDLLEFRARAEIVAPERLDVVPPGDRRYAGILSLGVHNHIEMDGFETSLGADLVMIGPQTGMDDVQSFIHRLLDYPEPLVASTQIPDALYPTLVAEVARNLDLVEDRATVRPFVEVQAGLETFLRAGVDLSFGGYGQGALMLRDQVSGQRYRAVVGDHVPGLTFTLGGDIARVFDSHLLPESGQAKLSDSRSRLRAGMAWQGKSASAFYGLAWLGKEFETQPEPQLVGTISFSLRF